MKKIIPVLVLLCVLLTACSSGGDPESDLTVKWVDGVIYVNGKATEVTNHSGYACTVVTSQGGLTWELSLDSAKDVTNIGVNTQSILEENMDTYKGKFYYLEYLGSKITMAKGLGNDTWVVAQAYTNGLPGQTCATYGSDLIDNISLTNKQLYVDFGSFTFGNEYDIVVARTDCCLIQGVAKVSKDPYSCTEPYVVTQGKKEYQLMKGSSARYDYYTYDGYTIQIAAGLAITDYITFK